MAIIARKGYILVQEIHEKQIQRFSEVVVYSIGNILGVEKTTER
jgi:hypothetical protein